MPTEEDLNALKRVNSAISHRNQFLEGEVARLGTALLLEQSARKVEQQALIQKDQIVAMHIQNGDSGRQKLENEIIQLRKEIKILKGE